MKLRAGVNWHKICFSALSDCEQYCYVIKVTSAMLFVHLLPHIGLSFEGGFGDEVEYENNFS